MQGCRTTRLVGLVLLFTLITAPLAWAGVESDEVEFPERPGEREFICDKAFLLNDAQKAELRERLDALLTELAIPIIVVTIRSQSDFGAGGMSIERYARRLFDHWGIGHPQLRVEASGMGRSNVQDRNLGILLLVAVGDRKARIELGADWGMSQNRLCKSIMDSHIVSAFKRDDYPGGILAGVVALEEMARGQPISSPPRPWWHYALIVVFFVAMILTGISLYQSGASGWAWLFWAAVFSILGALLWHILTAKGKSSGGGFSGGSFGGGFSGGGGATGSW